MQGVQSISEQTSAKKVGIQVLIIESVWQYTLASVGHASSLQSEFMQLLLPICPLEQLAIWTNAWKGHCATRSGWATMLYLHDKMSKHVELKQEELLKLPRHRRNPKF